MQLDSNQIAEILPHRYPFALVDRIEDGEEGSWARGRLCVSNMSPVFCGHFPQYHVLPGVLIVEALAQVPGVPPVRFDMIGNLQTNKINAVLGRAELIHSVSSLHLARSVSERALRRMEAGALAAPADVLIEVNVSGEASKSGFSPKELVCGLDELSGLRGIRVRGLMTMAPRGERDVARRTFAGLRELRDELRRRVPEMDLGELSCGMSEDFEVAVEEGSTLVRLGRVVFDPAFGIK